MSKIADEMTPEQANEVVRRFNAARFVPNDFPTIVCLCGSTRFWREFQRASLRETLAGKIVLSIGAARSADSDDRSFGGYVPVDEHDAIKAKLDQLHLRKIDLADEVLILDANIIVCGQCGKPGLLSVKSSQETECCRVKDWKRRPYIGESTRRELEYAQKHGKVVRFLSHEQQ